MQISEIELSNIIPYARNPRKNDAAVDKVAASLREFGWKQPIVVDGENTIIAGHTRYLAAKKLGMKSVPILIATDLSPQQIKAYRIADNRVAQEAQWDFDLLSLELDELQSLDVDLSLTGFDQEEIDSFIALGNATDEGLTDPDDVPEEQEDVVTKTGDVWILGNHRLICGDSTSADDVARCLNGVQPHLMVTDPPYGVEYDADWRNRMDRANGKPYGARAVGKVENDDRADWSEAFSLFPGDVCYVWHPPGALQIQFYQSLRNCNFEIRTQIIWSKSQFVIGRGNYHVQHEACWYAVKEKKGATAHWNGDRKQSTVWNIDKPRKSETGHSTQKPVECMRRPIENNSNPGQAVYEPFSGSGTTIIAAEQTGRCCYAIEIHSAYVDMAIRRWQNFTGKDAVHESFSKTFNELEQNRKAA